MPKLADNLTLHDLECPLCGELYTMALVISGTGEGNRIHVAIDEVSVLQGCEHVMAIEWVDFSPDG